MISAIQKKLDYLGHKPGPIDGILGPRTKRAILEYAEEQNILVDAPDSDCILSTLRTLNDLLSIKPLTNLYKADPDMIDDKEYVKSLIVKTCHQLGVTIPNQIAYVLATVDHETNGTFKPVKEAYWLTEDWRKQNLRYWPYYGRGFVQLTHKTNYEKYQKILDVPLVDNPDLAEDIDNALFILVHGMKTGAYTGKKLSDYINESKSSYVAARRIVNPGDRAKTVADLVCRYESKLYQTT